MNFDNILEREKIFIENISNINNYDNNIKHLLYIIIPAFIIKYGTEYERLIQDTFKNVLIIGNKEPNKQLMAFYTSLPYYNNNELNIKQLIIINNYNKNNLIEFIDSIVHEFNHALNSYKNTYIIKEDYIYLRTGLSYIKHDKNTLKPIDKDKSYVLEEILNTKQTEDIINIIKEIKTNDYTMNNLIDSINNETKNEFESKAYFLENYICKEILNNKTFTSTLSNLRINGNINDIEDWFNNICGKNKYEIFINSLNTIMNLDMKYSKSLFKKRVIIKIKKEISKIQSIIKEFDNNTF